MKSFDRRPSEFFSASIAPSNVQVGSNGILKIRGLASAFDSRISASYPTYIRRGAWTPALTKYGSTVLVLWNHLSDLPPIGSAKVWESRIGLEYEATLAKTPLALEVATLIKAKILHQVSVGFEYAEHHFEKVNGETIRIITAMERLFEVSPVNWPADPRASLRPVSSDVDDEISELVASYKIDREIARMRGRYKQ